MTQTTFSKGQTVRHESGLGLYVGQPVTFVRSIRRNGRTVAEFDRHDVAQKVWVDYRLISSGSVRFV